MNIDQILREEIDKTDFESPVYDFNVLGLSFLVWDKSEWSIELCETYPYRTDGEIPLIFVRLGKVEVMFENFFIYRLLYKRKYGILLDK